MAGVARWPRDGRARDRQRSARSGVTWDRWPCRPRRRAVGTGPEDLHSVRHVGKTVLAADCLGPPLDRRPGHLDRRAARPADQMVMMRAAATGTVNLLSITGVEHVKLAAGRHGLQCSIDSGQPDLVTGRT